MATENFRLAFPPHSKPSISTGLPFPQAASKHVEHTFHASKVYIIVSNSISKTRNFLDLQDALGDKVVGFRRGIRPHTPWDDVLDITRECRELGVDCIITLGAGSLTDGAKIVSLALANNVSSLDGLASIVANAENPCKVPIINIPTSLSGGEYNKLSGATDTRSNHKVGFNHPSMGTDIIILSPALTTSTPEGIWLSTSIRAVDHCVEAVCSLDKRTSVETDEGALKALKMLVPALLVTKKEWENEEARMMEMLAVVEVMKVLKVGIPMGASHGIGHQLGPLNVGHGVTSCIMLPAVMKYNFKHGDVRVRDKQQMVLDALWGESSVLNFLTRRGLEKEKADLGDVVDAIVRELGQPRSLSEVGVSRDQLDELALNCLKDPCLLTNPVPLAKKEQVLEVLEMVVGDKSSAL